MEAQASIVPGEPAIIDQPPGLSFEVIDNMLVRDVEAGLGREYRTPVSHQVPVAPVIAAQFAEIITEINAGTEELGIA
jgi:hypothetical protein